MTVRTGSCLCGARAYEIEGDLDGVWICHCSRCRKASGSTGNAILIVPVGRFRWVKGEDHGVSFALATGYSIIRCKTCGTLDTPLGKGVRTHLSCASRADWDRDEPDVRYFDERSS